MEIGSMRSIFSGGNEIGLGGSGIVGVGLREVFH